MNALWAIVAKDLITELRMRHVLPTMALLAIVLVTVFGLAMEVEVRTSPQMAAAILWVSFAFAGLLATERAFASETESRTLAALVTAPISRPALLGAKCLSSGTMLAAVQVVLVPVAMLMFEYSLTGPPWALLALLVLGDMGLVVLGTLASAIAAPAKARGPLLAVLVLPLLLPVLVVTTSCATELAARGWTDRAAHLMLVLLLFDVVFTTAALLLAPHVLET